jgi:hypothetical protein
MKNERYPFEQTKISLDDLCLKLVNEHSFSDIFTKLQTYVVDYHSGYEAWKGEDFGCFKDDVVSCLDHVLTMAVTMIKTFEKEDL